MQLLGLAAEVKTLLRVNESGFCASFVVLGEADKEAFVFCFYTAYRGGSLSERSVSERCTFSNKFEKCIH